MCVDLFVWVWGLLHVLFGVVCCMIVVIRCDVNNVCCMLGRCCVVDACDCVLL